MGTFRQHIVKTILAEKSGIHANSDLIYQKMLDALDNAHIDFGEDRIEFHIGRVIRNSDIDLSMVIRPSSQNNVRMGRNRNSNSLYIVVDTKRKLPIRSEIDSFLAKDRNLVQSIKSLIVKYLNEYHSSEVESYTEEENQEFNNDNFDMTYEELVNTLRSNIDECQGAMEELKAELDTEDLGKKETARMAIRELTKEYFGNNVDDFKKLAKQKLSGKEKGLTKENKDRLDRRLESFYEQKIKPVLFKE